MELNKENFNILKEIVLDINGDDESYSSKAEKEWVVCQKIEDNFSQDNFSLNIRRLADLILKYNEYIEDSEFVLIAKYMSESEIDDILENVKNSKDCSKANVSLEEKKKIFVKFLQERLKQKNSPDIRIYAFDKCQQSLGKGKGIIQNALCQSQIFLPMGSKKLDDKKINKKTVLNYGDNLPCNIVLHGYQPDQFDLTLYLGFVYFLQKNNESEHYSAFNLKEFCDYIGISKKNYINRKKYYFDMLKNRIFYLQFSHLTITAGKYTYTGQLVGESYFNNEDDSCIVKIPTFLYDWLNISSWTLINIEERTSLRKQSAQALHAFLSTHKCPYKGFWFNKDDLMKEWGAEYLPFKDKNYQAQNNEEKKLYAYKKKVFMKKWRTNFIKPLKEIGFITDYEEQKNSIWMKWKRNLKAVK